MPAEHLNVLRGATLVVCLLAASPLRAQDGELVPMSAKARTAVLDSVRAVLTRTYVDADTGRRIAAELSRRQRAKAYDSLGDAMRFAFSVTGDLRSINHDKHLGLRYRAPGMVPTEGARPVPQVVPAGPVPTMAPGGAPGPASGRPVPLVVAGAHDDMMAEMARRTNFGLRKLEILSGNIGYLEVTGFMEAPGAFEAIGDALRFLERTDAIIIDLRRNGGGSGEMSHMLFSHFLGETPVQTIRVRDRSDGSDTILTSVAKVPGPRRSSVPLYILTSNFSASAAEEFAFVLQNQKRATIVGARTAGAGHMNQLIDVGHGFELSVSYTRVSDPQTGKEWEQVGVTPDIAAEAGQALEVAHQHALKSLPPAPMRVRP